MARSRLRTRHRARRNTALANVDVQEETQQSITQAPEPNHKAVIFANLLALLRSIQWLAWTLHWTSKGTNYYGDHLLLQRLYEGEDGPDINASIDGLGERITHYMGDVYVGALYTSQLSVEILKQVEESLKGLLDLEKYAQELIVVAYEENKKTNFSVGLDDFLMALANDRDTAVYLLSRRLKV